MSSVPNEKRIFINLLDCYIEINAAVNYQPMAKYNSISLIIYETHQTKHQSVDSHDVVVPYHFIDGIGAFIHVTFLV